MESAKERKDNFCELREGVGVFDESVGVLENAESVGEGEEGGGVGRDREKELEGGTVLRRYGVAEAV